MPPAVVQRNARWLPAAFRLLPATSPVSLMSPAALVVPPSVPRSVMPLAALQTNACDWPAALVLLPVTCPRLLIATAELLVPPSVPRSIIPVAALQINAWNCPDGRGAAADDLTEVIDRHTGTRRSAKRPEVDHSRCTAPEECVKLSGCVGAVSDDLAHGIHRDRGAARAAQGLDADGHPGPCAHAGWNRNTAIAAAVNNRESRRRTSRGNAGSKGARVRFVAENSISTGPSLQTAVLGGPGIEPRLGPGVQSAAQDEKSEQAGNRPKGSSAAMKQCAAAPPVTPAAKPEPTAAPARASHLVAPVGTHPLRHCFPRSEPKADGSARADITPKIVGGLDYMAGGGSLRRRVPAPANGSDRGPGDAGPRGGRPDDGPNGGWHLAPPGRADRGVRRLPV